MLVLVVNSLLIFIPILLSVAFFTLMERKVLGLSQSRKGPNKAFFAGLLQPMADAVKLFIKESVTPRGGVKLIFNLSPFFGISLVLYLWSLAPVKGGGNFFSISIFLFLVILSLNLYPLLLAGWASNSKYAFIGALRGVAQTISYEISLALIIFCLLTMTKGLELYEIFESTFEVIWVVTLLPLPILWFISCMAETNRTPFDFAEGESELVSGFNVEYSAGNFALIFMAEYASILFLSLISALIGLGGSMVSIYVAATAIVLAFVWVWVRSTYPRYRYDKLMGLAWKSILPMALALSLFCLSFY